MGSLEGASPKDDATNGGGGGAVVETPSAECSAAAAVADEMQEHRAAEGFPAIFIEDADAGKEEEKWVGQYSSAQSILLVGEGDFSFSLALATGFGSGSNLVATSLDCFDTLKKKYSRAELNLAKLKNMGATILHGVNAKTMKLHADLKTRKFDRVVFNFPHAGFRGKEDQMHVINAHRELVKDFFRSASLLLRPHGEVHVSHKTKYPYNMWNLKELAAEFALDLVEQVDFQIADYPGYNNKRGDGLSCDQPFMLGKCSTFKFRIGDLKKMRRAHTFGSVPSIGNGRYHPNSLASGGCRPFYPPPLAPERPQPRVAFDMFSVPVGSGFSHYDAVQRCLPVPGRYIHGRYLNFVVSWPLLNKLT
uniref:25S rRNA (uridine-N(3))-methyltransferase BMT5-like domain-containing protein n=1 Tax=Brachypodium sylvaticum TaxID=29664 RepID=Q2L3C4_BRASY|nr:hypothetical protein [Brachypodium sylvaticum]